MVNVRASSDLPRLSNLIVLPMPVGTALMSRLPRPSTYRSTRSSSPHDTLSPSPEIHTIQPSYQVPAQSSPSSLAHIAAPCGFRIASRRARLIEATNSFVAVATRLDRIDDWKLGKPIATRIATIATVTINSISENPRCRIPPPLPVRTGATAPYPLPRGLQGRSGWAVGYGG